MLTASRFGKNRSFFVHFVYVSYLLYLNFIQAASSREEEPKLVSSRFSMIDRDSRARKSGFFRIKPLSALLEHSRTGCCNTQEAKDDIQPQYHCACAYAGSKHQLGIELDRGIIGLEVPHQAG
jgi:hypothetical protein